MWEASSRRSSMDGGKMCHAAFSQKSSKFCDHLKPNRQRMKVRRVESRKDWWRFVPSKWSNTSMTCCKGKLCSSWDVLWAGCEIGHRMCFRLFGSRHGVFMCLRKKLSCNKLQQNNIWVIGDVWWLHFMFLTTTASSVVVGTLPVNCWFIFLTQTQSLN